MDTPHNGTPEEPVMQVPTDDPVTQFREAFEDTAFHLLEPVHPEVNYSFEVLPADPYTLELRADKWWIGADEQLANETLTLNTYELETDEVQRVTVREEALLEREDLHRIYAAEGLEAAMHKAEDIAVANGYLDADRGDPRLFTTGPEDRFLTLQEQTVDSAHLLDEPPIDLEDTTPNEAPEIGNGYAMWDLDL